MKTIDILRKILKFFKYLKPYMNIRIYSFIVFSLIGFLDLSNIV